MSGRGGNRLFADQEAEIAGRQIDVVGSRQDLDAVAESAGLHRQVDRDGLPDCELDAAAEQFAVAIEGGTNQIVAHRQDRQNEAAVCRGKSRTRRPGCEQFGDHLDASESAAIGIHDLAAQGARGLSLESYRTQ